LEPYALSGLDYFFPPKSYYQELALVLADIGQHYANVAKDGAVKVKQSTWGTVKQRYVPVGVSLLLFDTANPIRFLFGSLASNIAVGNTVIVANLSSDASNQFWLRLKQELPKYLDSEATIVLESFNTGLSLLDKVALVSLFAERPESYPGILNRPNTQFISAKATSVVVVDEGSKSYEQVTSEILESFAFRRLRPESTNAVFVRDTEFLSFKDTFRTLSVEPSPDPALAKSLNTVEALSHLSPAVYSIELSAMLGRTKEVDINAVFDMADSVGVLLVISYRSIDQVIEALNNLKQPLKLLTFLAANTKDNSDYFEKWTNSEFFSVGPLRPAVPYAGSGTLFPARIFGKTRTFLSGSGIELKQSFEDVAKHVEASVRKPKEAPNQTLDFFGYMQRVVVGAAVFIMGVSFSGICIWYTKRDG
jgi:hypothetical protein